MPGPPPKPTAIKAAEGNPGKRKLNPGDLAEAAKRPKCPAWLDEEARKKWRELTGILMERRVLRRDDQALLSQFCQDWSDLVLARRQFHDLGEKRLLVSTEAGPRVNPLLRIIERKTESLVRISARFGFSPADRARIMFEEPFPGKEADPLEALLAGPVKHHKADRTIQ